MTPVHEITPLITFWSKLEERAPYIHPADRAALRYHQLDLRRHGVQINLLPQPWVGPIKTARAFVLQLNPGFSDVETEFEQTNHAFHQALWANLSGELPNVFLDPNFPDHPGQGWVIDVLKGVAPINTLAREIAQIELFPYHSKTFTDMPKSVQKLLLNLPSVNIMRNWVHKAILPAAMSGAVAIVVQRRAKDWAIDERHTSRNIVVYQGGHCQGGYVTANTEGGKLIRRHLMNSGVLVW